MDPILIAYETAAEVLAFDLRNQFTHLGVEVQSTVLETMNPRSGPLIGFSACVLVITNQVQGPHVEEVIPYIDAMIFVVHPPGRAATTLGSGIVARYFPNDLSLSVIAQWIVGRVEAQEAIERAKLATTAAKVDKIVKNIPAFIDPTIARLEQQMSQAKASGLSAYRGGIWALYLALASAILFTFLSPVPHDKGIAMFVGSIGYNAFRGLIVIAILVAISKYLFNLGKAWLTESLRNADRIHAISFGRFYLEVYGGEANSEDVRAVFETWNIDSNSTFAKLDANDHDPKLFDRAMELVGKSTELLKAAVEKGKDDKKDEK